MTKPIRAVMLLCCLVGSSAAFAEGDNPPDERGLAKLKRFMEICSTNDDLDAAAKLVVAEKLVHASKLDKNDPSKMNSDSMRFAFKKAHQGARLYDPTPKVTRYLLTGVSAVGFGPTAQKGKVYKYFVAKKEGVNGMPAPIHIFYPDDGSEPVVYDFGSF